MKIAKFIFTYTEDHKIDKCYAEEGATQADAARAVSVLTRMRKAVELLKGTLPLA